MIPDLCASVTDLVIFSEASSSSRWIKDDLQICLGSSNSGRVKQRQSKAKGKKKKWKQKAGLG